MTCYAPLVAWKSRDPDDIGASGKIKLVFKPELGYPNTRIEIACGQCIGCRLDKARAWAIRCIHEATLYPNNMFLTLTYDDNHLPDGNTLVKSDLQKFLKRLRKHYAPTRIRFFACGEYGDRLARPHYHCLIFNLWPTDALYYKKVGEHEMYTSSTLAGIWGKGWCPFGRITYDSASYTARYILKKITGDNADEHYQGRTPEFTQMSRRPGIGREWYEKWKSDIYTHDKCVLPGGWVARPPSYYDNLFDIEEPDLMRTMKKARQQRAKENPENTDERRAIKWRCAENKALQIPRKFESGTSTAPASRKFKSQL